MQDDKDFNYSNINYSNSNINELSEYGTEN